MKYNLLKKFSLLLLLFLVFNSCKKDEEVVPVVVEEDQNGAVFATVTVFGQVVSGATVTTMPETGSFTTSGTGSVLMQNIPSGIYQICAFKEGIGSGSSAIVVDKDEITQVQINLIPGVFENPMVDIVSTSSSVIGLDEPFEVIAVASDNIDGSESLSFSWSTDIDGEISTVGIGMSGYAVLNTSFSTEGPRILTVTVTDSDGNTGTDQISFTVLDIPEPVVLNPIENDGSTLVLNWSQSESDEFELYRVYRSTGSSFQIVGIIDVITSTQFIDENLVLGQVYIYKIATVLQGGTEIFSNEESGVYAGDYIQLSSEITMLRMDPNSSVLLALAQDANSLIFIDTENFEVMNTIFVGSSPTDMDFSMDGQHLYIANYGSSQIAKVNISSQTLESNIFVQTDIGNWDGNPYTLAVLSENRLAFTSEDQWNSIKVVDINSGTNLQDFGSVYQPYILASNDGDDLFIGESGSSGSELIKYSSNGSEFVFNQESGNGTSAVRQMHMTADGDHIFYQRKKFLSANVTSILGTFTETIYAINPQGNRALGNTKVFNGDTFILLGSLAIETTVSAFHSDGTTAFLFDEDTNRLYKLTID
jgi:fibronectin type 3 domain-containing protein